MGKLSIVSRLYTLPLFILLAGFTVIVLLPLQESLDTYMQEFKRETIEGLEKRIGRKIAYDRISPSILLSLHIYNIRIEPFDTDRDENLHIGSIEVFYSILDLLKGDTLEAVNEITVKNSTLRIDKEQDAEFIRFLEEAIAPETDAPPEVPLEKVTLTGENISLFYNDGGSVYELKKLFFQLNNSGDPQMPLSLSSRGEFSVALEEPLGTETLNFTEARGSFFLDGLLSESFDTLSSTITLQNFSNNLFSFHNLTLGINRNRERTSIRKIEDSSPWDIEARYDEVTEEVSLDFAARDFAFSDNVSTGGEFEPYSVWLNTRVSGNAQVTYSLAEKHISYSADLTAVVNNSQVPEAFTAEFLAEGTEERVFFKRLRVSSRSADLEYEGSLDTETLLPEGSLEVNRLSLADHSFRTTLDLSSSGEKIEIKAPYLLVDSVLRLDNISVSGVLTESLLNYDAEFSLSRQGESGHFENRTESEGTISFGASPSFEGSINMEYAPLLPLVETLRPDISLESVPFKKLTVSTNAFVSADPSSFFFSLQTLELEDREEDFFLTSRVHGNNNQIQLSETSVSYNNYRIDGNTLVDFSSSDSIVFNSSFNMNSEVYTLSGTFYKNSTLILRGNHDIKAALFFQNGNIAFSGSAENLPIFFDEKAMEVSLKGRGRFSDQESWYGHLSSLSIESPPGLPEGSSLSFSAKVDPKRVKISNIRYADTVSELAGEAWYSPETRDIRRGSGWLTLSTPSDDETYRTVFSLLDNNIEATMSVNKASLSRFDIIPVSGKLSGVFRARGPIDDPVIDFSSNIEKGEFNNSPFELKAEGSLESTRLTLSNVQGNYNSHNIRDAEGDYLLKEGSLRLEGEYRSTLGKKASSTHFLIEGEVTPIESLQSMPIVLNNDYSALISLSDLVLLGERRDPWNIEVEKEEERVDFKGGPENAIVGTFGENGEYTLRMASPLPVRLISEGQIFEGEIDSSVHDIYVDMTSFEDLGFTRVLFASGTITGDISIEGALSDPEFSGTLFGNSVSGTIEEVAEPVDPFSTGIEFDGKEVVVEPVNVTVGDGAAVLSGGFTFDRWTPSEIRIQVSTVGSRGVPVTLRLREAGLSIDGYGLGDFSVTLGSRINRIEGDLTVSDCIITMQEREEASPDESPPPVIVDMQIETGSSVEFLWPRRRLPILSAYADTGQNVSIYYNSLEERLRFTGEVNIKGGEIFYFQRSFFLREGSITFNETEDRFDPLLNAKAELREIDISGNPVTISLIVENEPVKSFTPRFESNPQLSMQEIAQILGTSIYGSPENQELSLSSALMLTGDLFAQFGVVRTFENQIKEVFNLDLFSLRTRLVQNVIIDRLGGETVTPGTEETFEQTDPLDRYLDNTTLFLGKYLGNDLFLEALLQIRQQPRYTGDLQDQELNFSLEVGLEWKTPLFLLNLSINPDFYEPEKSFGNTRFGLSWDYSY